MIYAMLPTASVKDNAVIRGIWLGKTGELIVLRPVKFSAVNDNAAEGLCRGPPINLVAEWDNDVPRRVRWGGRGRGVAKVLSTITGMPFL